MERGWIEDEEIMRREIGRELQERLKRGWREEQKENGDRWGEGEKRIGRKQRMVEGERCQKRRKCKEVGGKNRNKMVIV